MGRGKNLNGAEPWKEYGLTKGAYYNRMRKGIPFDKQCRRGRPGDIELAKLREEFGEVRKAEYGRFSGKSYENPKEKLLMLREKYKNGIPDGLVENWIMNLG